MTSKLRIVRAMGRLKTEGAKVLVAIVVLGLLVFVAYLMFFRMVAENHLSSVLAVTVKNIEETSKAAGRAIESAENSARLATRVSEDAEKTAGDAKKRIDAKVAEVDSTVLDLDRTIKALNERLAAQGEEVRMLEEANRGLRELNAQLEKLRAPDRLEDAEKVNTLIDRFRERDGLGRAWEMFEAATPVVHKAEFISLPEVNLRQRTVPETKPIALRYPGRERYALLTASGVLLKLNGGTDSECHIQFCDQDGKRLNNTMWYWSKEPQVPDKWAPFSLSSIVRLDRGVTSVRLQAMRDTDNNKKANDPVFQLHAVSLEVLEWPVRPE